MSIGTGLARLHAGWGDGLTAAQWSTGHPVLGHPEEEGAEAGVCHHGRAPGTGAGLLSPRALGDRAGPRPTAPERPGGHCASPWFKQGTWGPASGERVGKAQTDTRGGGQSLAASGHSTDGERATQAPHRAPPCGGPMGLEGKDQVRDEKSRHTRISRCCPTGNDGCRALETEVTSASNETIPGHRPGQVTLSSSR